MVAREVFDLRALWTAIEALDSSIAADVQLDMLLEGRKLVERATRWLVRSRPRPLDIAAEIERFAPGAALLAETLQGVLHGADRPRSSRRRAVRRRRRARRAGRPVAGLGALFSALDIVEVADATGHRSRRSRPSTTRSARASSSSGSATRSPRSRATTAGRPSRARRSATSSTASTAPSPARRSRPARRARPEARAEPGTRRTGRASTGRSRSSSDIPMGGLSSLETLSVALREVRNLIQSGARAPRHRPCSPEAAPSRCCRPSRYASGEERALPDGGRSRSFSVEMRPAGALADALG